MSDSTIMEKKIEDSLIDLYLNVKVRTTEEVIFLLDRRLQRQQIYYGKRNSTGARCTPAHRVHQVINRNIDEHEIRGARRTEEKRQNHGRVTQQHQV